jgi:hypothetical protein
MFYIALCEIQALPKDLLCRLQFSCRNFNHEPLVSRDDDVTASALALGLGDESEISDGVVNDLALIGAHRLQRNGPTGFLDLGNGVFCDLLKDAGTFLAVSVDVQHQTGPAFSCGKDR